MPAPARSSGFPDPDHDHSSCLAGAFRRAEARFEARGLRLTPLRREVFEEVAGSHVAIGAYEVLDRMARKSGRRLAPISVYRALDSLVEAGVVHRLESRNAFFACHSGHAPDRCSVVLACEQCGSVAEVGAPAIFDGIAAIAAKAAFVPGRALVEVIGNCGSCTARAGSR